MIACKALRRATVWPQGSSSAAGRLDQEAVTMPGGEQVLLVGQNVELALDIADRAYVLDQGAVVHHAAASELLADDEIRERNCSV
jgi:ABC-type branched-subunit amino acid transport system ATPase component